MNSDQCRDFIKEAGETCRPVTEWDSTAICALIFFGTAIVVLIYNLLKESKGSS